MSRIVHLGVGNFHRAHQAWYTQEANRLAEEDWRITGVSLRSPAVRDALRPQGFAYALVAGDRTGMQLHRIDVLDDILVAPEDPVAVVAALADAEVAAITVTVTEKGYHLGPGGTLEMDSPAIAADLEAMASGDPPSSMIGLLTAGLTRRARTGDAVTVLSCDNLVENGPRLRAAVQAFAEAAGLEIADYLREAVTFPASMVDRITPSTDDAVAARLAGTDLPPAAPVATEAFSEWVIEDAFAGDRPAWDRAGAVLAGDVGPYETRKLRMLNAAHSYLAYAGLLAGHAFVHEAVADARLREGALALMDEATATLVGSARVDAAYAAALVSRFENPFLEHRLRQIAMDGSLKLPIRVLGTLRARAARGLASPACEATVAAWAAFLAEELRAGRPIDDPDAARLEAGLASGLAPRDLLGDETIGDV